LQRRGGADCVKSYGFLTLLNAARPFTRSSAVRDSLEHIDERLDRVLHDDMNASVSDWYLSDGRLFMLLPEPGQTDPTPLGMRAFVPRIGRLYFNATSLDMLTLDIDMVTLRHHVLEATAELKPRLKGRFEFGNIQLVAIPGMPSGEEAVTAWRAEREERIALLPIERERLLEVRDLRSQ